VTWLQIKLQASPDQAALLSELLADLGAVAVSLEDGADEPLFEPALGAHPLWSQTRVSALFEGDTDVRVLLGKLRSSLAQGVLPPYRTELLQDRDWQEQCRDQFQPRRFGERLWIRPSWHAPLATSAPQVVLDPGLAFGTGAHPTTAMCLEWLARAPLDGVTLIDYGCGSGILGVAAAKLGAAVVWAVDIDPQARQATADNARINGVSERITVTAPEGLPVGLQAQVLVANILAGPLIALADTFGLCVSRGGALVLSGILSAQVDAIAAAYRARFALKPPLVTAGWARLEGVRS
jgi:ribosomal protein L11 methyltransferase